MRLNSGQQADQTGLENMQTVIWKTITGAAVAAGLIATAAVAQAGTMRLGMTTWVGCGPMFLARDKGFWPMDHPRAIGCHAFRDELPAAIAMLKDCATRAAKLIDRHIGLDHVPDAYRRLKAGEAEGLKTIIRV